jgi:hypothetical protein
LARMASLSCESLSFGMAMIPVAAHQYHSAGSAIG